MPSKALRRRILNFIQRIPRVFALIFYVYRFFQPKYTVGVIGIIVNEKGEVLLVEHVFHPERPWGMPGGWIGRNEDPAAAVKREIREELSMDVSIKQLLHTAKTQRNHLDVAYLCEPQGEVGTLSYELLNYRWTKFEDLPTLYKFHTEALEEAKRIFSKQSTHQDVSS